MELCSCLGPSGSAKGCEAPVATHPRMVCTNGKCLRPEKQQCTKTATQKVQILQQKADADDQ